MTHDLEIGWRQIKWLRREGERFLHADDLEPSVQAMFDGLEIVNIDVDNDNPITIEVSPNATMTYPRITVSFKHEHELTAARLLL